MSTAYRIPTEAPVDLYVGDTRDSKFQLIAELAERAPELLPPIYIISHRRETELPTFATFPALQSLGTLVVAEAELEDYRLWWPDANIEAIPDDYAAPLTIGHGRAVQYVLDLACDREQEHIFMLDDDITGAAILYSTGPEQCSSAFTKIVDDREAFYLGLLVLAAQAAEEVFREVPGASLVGPQNRNGARTAHSAATLWDTNIGRFPNQSVSWHVPRFMEQVGGIDLDGFNVQGADLYCALMVLQAGGSCARVPSVLFSYLPEHDGRSTVRTPENTMAIRLAERAAIEQLDICKEGYVRKGFSREGEFRGSAPDWRKLRKDGKVAVLSSGWI